MKRATGGGILVHKFEKRLESLAPWYSQFLLLVDFRENDTPLWFFKSVQKNPRNKKNFSPCMNTFCRKETEGRKSDKNLTLRRLEFLT